METQTNQIQAYQIRFDQIVFCANDDEVHQNCQNPYKNHPDGCLNYEHNWSCPPHSPTVSDTQASLKTYTYFWILIIEYPIPKNKLNFIQRWKTKKEFARITKELNNFLSYLQSNHREWKIFYCSHCELCKEKNFSGCTCPSAPCRYSNKIRISPEAAGIQVFDTLLKLDHSIETDPTTKLKRIGMCATDEKVEFAREFKNYRLYNSILNKFDNL
ncbi:MAG: DUF2284 domain-containing protein [Promethearchaeota archaeon]